MSDNIIVVPTATTDVVAESPALVPLSSLTGSDLTKAVRAWAVAEGLPVADRGAIAPEVTVAAVLANPSVPAPVIKAKRAPAAPKVPNVFDVHTTDGACYRVAPGRGRATLERLARCAGVDVSEIEHVRRGGEVVDVPNAAAGPVAEPWVVTLTNGSTREYRGNSRGRMSVGRVADALGIKPASIASVARGDKVYRVATVAHLVGE